MTSLEIRQVITEHLSHIDDESFLNALKTIVESKVSDGEYKLSDFQRNRIDIARQELKNGQSISHDDLQNEINQWLKSK